MPKWGSGTVVLVLPDQDGTVTPDSRHFAPMQIHSPLPALAAVAVLDLHQDLKESLYVVRIALIDASDNRPVRDASGQPVFEQAFMVPADPRSAKAPEHQVERTTKAIPIPAGIELKPGTYRIGLTVEGTGLDTRLSTFRVPDPPV